jgi:hypothetical protein
MLKKISISANSKTPEISLNPDGLIQIRGRSITGEVKELPKEVENWLDTYLMDPCDVTLIEIKLEYIGGFKTGYYVDLLRKAKRVLDHGKKLVVRWYYEEGDEDILERGECFSLYLDLPFNFIEIKDTSPI